MGSEMCIRDRKCCMWIEFQSISTDFEGFLRALRFPPSSKLTPSLFQFERMQDLPENHFRVSGVSWINIISYYYYLLLLVQTSLKCCFREKRRLNDSINLLNSHLAFFDSTLLRWLPFEFAPAFPARTSGY